MIPIIKDYKNIKITKVKYWCIHFWYEDKHYMLHYNAEGRITMLYLINQNKTSAIKYVYGDIISDCEKFYGKGKVYSQFNKFNFVFMLDFYNLIKSEFHQEVIEYTKQRNNINSIRRIINVL